MSFWAVVVGAVAFAFWGLVLAFVLKWARKLERIPRWPIIGGLIVGALYGAMSSASY
ncbi:hypothetical protein [Brevundimonas sp.]|uniref:hypothetical protein n=1 Tax=Brevundimonas sp. TaxID=1871086 RepID=UPI002613C981|nr:hypothetical protein [Brevundimonas sp.]